MAEECTVVTQISLAFNVLTVVIILYFAFMLIKLRNKIWKKANTFAFIGNYVYCGLILICAIIYMNANVYRCVDGESLVAHEINTIGNGFYVLQYILLLILLFYRLCTVFGASQYAISSRIIGIFCFILVCLTASAIACILLLNDGEVSSLANTFGIFAMVGVFLLISIIIATFIQRLSKIWWRCDADGTCSSRDHIWEALIIKTFILTLLSIMSLVVVIVSSLVGIWIPDQYYMTLRQFGYAITLGIDLVTNLMSLFYGIHVFNKHYLFLFGICDRALVKALENKKKNMSMMLQEAVQSNSPTSVAESIDKDDSYPEIIQ